MSEAPVAWRVWWFVPSDKPFDPLFKPERAYRDFATQAEAETEKQIITGHLGERAAVCIEPRYVSRRQREVKYRSSQDNLGVAGWPLQKRLR